MHRLPPDVSDPRTARIGVLYGVAAYLWWGGVPAYFKAVAQVSPLEVLAHRVIWSAALLSILLLHRRRVHVALQAVRSRRTLCVLSVTTVLVASNWLIFIWAVANGYVLQASLGYFINPLLTVLLGMIFLGERLRRWQTVSVVLAGVGVTYMTAGSGTFPWVAFGLALTFGFYGLLRKTAPVDALVGLTIETVLLGPLALAYLVYLMIAGSASFGAVSRSLDLLLILAGVVTATPLLWFTESARRLRLSTVGFLQYIAPTGQFLLAVVAYREPFTGRHLVTFCCIWAALVIYSLDAARTHRRSPVGRV
jgi:chloramphenicol-sensitive protein RarD